MAPHPARAQSFVISTPGGDVTVEVPHVAPQGSLVEADSPTPPGFRPPSIFSAPLPSGSGARALGVADSFTAVADDATAASWNPGGLIQLERPEFSFTLRLSREQTRHESGDPDVDPRDAQTDFLNLNYASLVLPFQLAGRNFVLSLNLQEAYDFTQRFGSLGAGRSGDADRASASRTYSDVDVQDIVDGATELTVTSHLTTTKTSVFDQLLRSELMNDLAFEQEGIVYAFSPALAVEVTPALAVGAAVNLYRDGAFAGQPVRSRTRVKYSGTTESRVAVTDTVTTRGDYEYEGVFHIPPGGDIPVPIDVPFSGEGDIEPFTDTAGGSDRKGLYVEGIYEERNAFDDLEGVNVTLGGLWTLSRRLRLGGAVDLPWTARARQRKTVRNTATTYDASRARILDVAASESGDAKDVEFDFPLRWSLGALWRWTDLFYSTLDISRTHWSDFSFRADGDPRLNPLDGSLYGENPVDDTWRISGGLEYLLVFRKTEVPLRAGIAWEERPAVGAPDRFWHFTLGLGLSIGQGPGKVILDAAYVYAFGDDVLGTLVPGQDLRSDVDEHQVFVSLIKHL